MPPVTINVSKEFLNDIDAAVSSTNMSRSAWIVTACKAALSDTAHEGERITTLNNEIDSLKDSLGYMRLEYSKLNDVVSQRLLTEARPRRSFIAWLRGRD
jgi:hypothetical protein